MSDMRTGDCSESCPSPADRSWPVMRHGAGGRRALSKSRRQVSVN